MFDRHDLRLAALALAIVAGLALQGARPALVAQCPACGMQDVEAS